MIGPALLSILSLQRPFQTLDIDDVLESLCATNKTKWTRIKLRQYVHKRFCCSSSCHGEQTSNDQKHKGIYFREFVKDRMQNFTVGIRGNKMDLIRLFRNYSDVEVEDIVDDEDRDLVTELNHCKHCSEMLPTNEKQNALRPETQKAIDALESIRHQEKILIDKLRLSSKDQKTPEKEVCLTQYGIRSSLLAKVRQEESDRQRLMDHKQEYTKAFQHIANVKQCLSDLIKESELQSSPLLKTKIKKTTTKPAEHSVLDWIKTHHPLMFSKHEKLVELRKSYEDKERLVRMAYQEGKPLGGCYLL